MDSNVGCIAKQGQVSEEIDNINKSIDDLIGVVNNLEDRLTPILNPIPPKNEGCDKSPTQTVALAQAIKVSRIKIQTIKERIIGILDRCQL